MSDWTMTHRLVTPPVTHPHRREFQIAFARLLQASGVAHATDTDGVGAIDSRPVCPGDRWRIPLERPPGWPTALFDKVELHVWPYGIWTSGNLSVRVELDCTRAGMTLTVAIGRIDWSETGEFPGWAWTANPDTPTASSGFERARNR